MVESLPVRDALPGFVRLSGLTVITLRHLAGDTSARAAVQDQGLPWCEAPGELTGSGPWLAWRSPRETLALGFDATLLPALLQALAPGRSESAVAVDLSQALAVFELQGARIDEWLAHLVDASSIPRQAGRAARCRMMDVAVFLLRLDANRLLLLVDRPVAAYVENWLAYAHEGAFALGS